MCINLAQGNETSGLIPQWQMGWIQTSKEVSGVEKQYSFAMKFKRRACLYVILFCWSHSEAISSFQGAANKLVTENLVSSYLVYHWKEGQRYEIAESPALVREQLNSPSQTNHQGPSKRFEVILSEPLQHNCWKSKHLTQVWNNQHS